jgi:Uri superfamily endonuclease
LTLTERFGENRTSGIKPFPGRKFTGESLKGVYAAFFLLEDDEEIQVGALGEKKFKEGLYVYVGSAMNSLESRLERHFSSPENLQWHIDYFSQEATPVYWLAFPLDSSFECVLSECASTAGVPVEDFGSSDCDCSSHLYRVGSGRVLKEKGLE